MVKKLPWLELQEVLETARKVCTSWRRICKESSMWRVINMSNDGDLSNMPYNLKKMCRYPAKSVLVTTLGHEWLRNFLRDLEEFSFLIHNRITEVVALSSMLLSTRSGKLKRLSIAYCYGMVCDGLVEAVQKLHCSKSLPTLHHLQLIGNSITNKGLEAILDSCPHLVSLDLRLCNYVSLNAVLSSRLSGQIKDVKLSHDSLAGLDFSFKACGEEDDDMLLVIIQ
ncbi:putative F-box/LRR-repeat protein 23 [Lycium barbarum]|uniref:putative F-box/LRR-repeat protein 23 n=1 Tax=Lycium barbarum TaxID=112863 RepID=UPI00293E593D|nr:putative F-box/LRR-repeat protein 23 [Lycium barbarum]